MNIIKLFDKNQTENIGSTLALQPQSTVFLGSGALMDIHGDVYDTLLKKRSIPTKLRFLSTDGMTLDQMSRCIREVLTLMDDPLLDLTGGTDLMLAAAGMALQELRSKGIRIQACRYDARTGIVTDCDGDGAVPEARPIAMTVAENVALRGGGIRNRIAGEDTGTEPWPKDGAFPEDVNRLWDICREDPALWNTLISDLPAFEHCPDGADTLNVFIRMPEGYIRRQEMTELLQKMVQAGVVSDYAEEEDRLFMRYKSAEVKRALRKAGTVHELKILYLCAGMKNPDGTRFFHDAVNGVYIDWDGILHSRNDPEKDTANEIDVLLTRGMMPVFISCKNGIVPEDELYKLHTVADRFGGKFARKLLTATYVGKSRGGNEYLRTRAADMNITMIENIHQMTDREITDAIRAVFNVQPERSDSE